MRAGGSPTRAGGSSSSMARAWSTRSRRTTRRRPGSAPTTPPSSRASASMRSAWGSSGRRWSLEPGVYDERYLDQIAGTVRMLAAHGIASLLDFHQDMFNERFQGEGAPDWAVQDDGLPAQPQLGFPANYYSMPALQHALENFWANAPAPAASGFRTALRKPGGTSPAIRRQPGGAWLRDIQRAVPRQGLHLVLLGGWMPRIRRRADRVLSQGRCRDPFRRPEDARLVRAERAVQLRHGHARRPGRGSPGRICLSRLLSRETRNAACIARPRRSQRPQHAASTGDAS